MYCFGFATQFLILYLIDLYDYHYLQYTIVVSSIVEFY